MSHNILLILGAFILSITCGFYFIPHIIKYCKTKGLYDLPDSRKVHKNAIPRLGGIAFLPSMFIAFILVVFAFEQITGEASFSISLWSVIFFVSLLVIYTTGIIDDIMGLSAKFKFIVQLVTASLLPLSGLYINNLYGLCGIHDIPFYIGMILTVFVIVFIVNAINLIDGIDGLSASLTFIALGGFLYQFFQNNLLAYSILIVSLMGVLIPYIYFNMFGNPDKGTKIFMGDSGSLTLGFILGFLAVKYSMDNPNIVSYRANALLYSYTLLIVPVFDVVRIILYRLRHGASIFSPDKNHIHHKVMRAGFSQHQALGIIVSLALAFILINLIVYKYLDYTLTVLLDIVIYIVFNLCLNAAIKRKGVNV